MSLLDLLPPSARRAYDLTLEYLRRVLIAIDMLGNVLTGGQPGETISYRSAVLSLKGNLPACWMCKFLDLFQANHCTLTLAAGDKQRILFGEAASRGDHPL